MSDGEVIVSDKLTKDCAERAMALDDFKQSTKK